MSRITHLGIQASLSLVIALSAFAPLRAETPSRYDYGYCYGIAGNPRVEVVTPVFNRPSVTPYDGGPSSFANTVGKKFGDRVREPGCSYSPTAAEAQAKRQAMIDQISKSLGPQAVYLLDWKPPAANAPTPEPRPEAQSAAPVSQSITASPAPKPAPAAPVADKQGLFVVCNGIDLNAGKLFFNPPVEVTSGDANAWSASYAKYLLTNYKYDRNIACNKLPTLAEADSYYKETSDARQGMHDLMGNPAPVVVTKWKYP